MIVMAVVLMAATGQSASNMHPTSVPAARVQYPRWDYGFAVGGGLGGRRELTEGEGGLKGSLAGGAHIECELAEHWAWVSTADLRIGIIPVALTSVFTRSGIHVRWKMLFAGANLRLDVYPTPPAPAFEPIVGVRWLIGATTRVFAQVATPLYPTRADKVDVLVEAGLRIAFR